MTYGLDTLLVTYFAALLISLRDGLSSLVPWVVAAIVAVAGRQVLPEGWNIVAAAIAGGVIGAWRTPLDVSPQPEPAQP